AAARARPAGARARRPRRPRRALAPRARRLAGLLRSSVDDRARPGCERPPPPCGDAPLLAEHAVAPPRRYVPHAPLLGRGSPRFDGAPGERTTPSFRASRLGPCKDLCPGVDRTLRTLTRTIRWSNQVTPWYPASDPMGFVDLHSHVLFGVD